MKCNNCGNDHATVWKLGFEDNKPWEQCDGCGAQSRGVPDIYFKGSYMDENLSSESHPGPKFITSRQEKKMWLEKCGLREAGDRVHGATTFDRISNKHAVKSLEQPRRK
jgi:predicted nucleic acid-binding Zn ribbon protein